MKWNEKKVKWKKYIIPMSRFADTNLHQKRVMVTIKERWNANRPGTMEPNPFWSNVGIFKSHYIKHWYFVSKIVLTYCKKKMLSLTETTYLNREKSEQFLKQNTFSTFYGRPLQILYIKQSKWQLVQIMGCRNLQDQVRKLSF